MTTTLEKQIDLRQVANDTYIASWHVDWTIGPSLHGGGIAAVIQHTAVTHLQTDTRFRNQPHLLNLHLEFLRACERRESVITVTVLKIGAAVSTLQLQLQQNDQIKVLALVTSTNFDQPLGPSIPTSESWTGLLPPPRPKPDFDQILGHKPDANWVPCLLTGEVIPMTGRILGLYPRGGFVAPGICDAWHSFLGDERINETYISFMADLVPSLSDTLLRNGGMYDAQVFQQKAERWADEHPGVTCICENTLAEAAKATIFNNTLTLDIEFKKSLPEKGLRFVLIRTATKMLVGGRMDLEVTILDEDMELVCMSRQVILVLDAVRKFGSRKKKQSPRI